MNEDWQQDLQRIAGHPVTRAAYRWMRFMWWTLAQQVDRILTEVYCTLTVELRQSRILTFLAPQRLLRFQMQRERIGQRLVIEQRFEPDEPPSYRPHLRRLATLRRPQGF